MPNRQRPLTRLQHNNEKQARLLAVAGRLFEYLCYSINAVRSLGVKHTAMMLLTVKFSKPEQDILSELYQKSLVYEAFLQSATQMANGTTNSEPVYTFSFEHKHQWILHCTAGLI
jgi:hypothetical protein